jgi:DNA-binding XRE family transcriptional regulator
MDEAKKARLERAGWRFGDAADFLGMTPEEVAFVEVKLGLADFLREMRVRNSWTQAQVARRLGSSQSRVAKMERGDPSVSLDLLVRALLTLGASTRDVARVISRAA